MEWIKDNCWIIPLLVGLICALLGYLLGRLFGKGSDNSLELNEWQNKYGKLEADLAACKKARIQLEGDLAACNAKLSAKAPPTPPAPSADMGSSSGIASSFAVGTAAASLPFDADLAKSVFGKKIKQDDLTLVEGIGPKIQELFHNFDIKTWKALSETSVDKCQEVLNSGGKRYEIHKPGTWPRQAKMAYEGKWKELWDWQEVLDGGKE